MSNITSRTYLLAIVVALASLPAITAAQSIKPESIQPKTVVDYFLLLPSTHFWTDDLAARKAMLFDKHYARRSTVDSANDYILMPGGDTQPTLNVKLFRFHGKTTVAVLDGGYDPQTPTLDFLSYENAKWRNVDKTVLPDQAWTDLPRDSSDFQDNHVTFRLPRYGTTIEVFDSGGATEYDLVWRGGKFREQD